MTSSNRSALFIAFAGMGATAALVPAVLPLFVSSFGHREQLLQAAPTLFAGLLLGVLLSPLLSRPRGVATTVRLGAAVQAAALVLLACAVQPWTVFAAAALGGIGFGLVEASGTAFARQVAVERTARMLASLTATVAIVAAVAPLLVLVTGATGFRFVLVAAAVAQLAAAVLVRGGSPSSASVTAVSSHRLGAPVVLIAVALFCYVGVESSLSGLSAATVQSTLQTSAAVAAVGTSAFWLLMTAGRLAGAAVLARGARPWLLAVVALAVVSVLFLVATITAPRSPVLGVALLGVAVLFCGPCYALLIGSASDWISSANATAPLAALIAVGAIGGTVLPAVVIALGGLPAAAWLPASAGLVAVVAVGAGRFRAREVAA
jgi:hypothetical protein